MLNLFMNYKKQEQQKILTAAHAAIGLAGGSIYKLSAYDASIAFFVLAIVFGFLSYLYWFLTDCIWYFDSEYCDAQNREKDADSDNYKALDAQRDLLCKFGMELQLKTYIVCVCMYFSVLSGLCNAFVWHFIALSGPASLGIIALIFMGGLIVGSRDFYKMRVFSVQ